MIRLVQQYFSHSAALYPNKPAICCNEDEISYKQADEFSNAFSRAIQQAGVKRGEFVAFFMKKSVNSILSILSILKADCAYVPIDVNSPAPRLISILDTTKAKIIITDSAGKNHLQSILPDDQQPILLDISDFDPKAAEPNAIVPSAIEPVEYENLSIDMAYVLFTSGSTGIPKGVMIPHKAIIDYIEWCVETYQITHQDVVSNHAPLYFDNSTFDLYTAFKTGATLHLVHDELNSVLPRIIKWLNQRSISIFFCVPSVLTLLLKSRRLKPDSFPNLRHLICAGEVLPPDVLREWMLMYPKIQFTNMYGPTEITVDCTSYTLTKPPEKGCLSVPIGPARTNMELFVRTEDGSLTKKIGAQGELLVRGTAVAYGYLGDEAKTKAAFIQNPNNPYFHDPLYCTGDLVELDESGNFLYLGRADNQIKHLGYRIELGEIEAALVAIDQVVEGVVVYGKRADQDESEIGALVSLSTEFDATKLKQELSTKLPSYMVPTLIKINQQEFPRTPNGKYDRKIAKKMVYGE